MKRRTLLSGMAAGLIALAAGAAPVLAWTPEKPISIVVGFPPGGGTDIIARAVTSAAQAFFPVPLVIVNRAGASGTIAAEYVRNALPDGHTLLVAGGSESTSVGNHQKLPYDIRTDFTAIIQFNRQRTLLAVKGDAPWKTLEDFVRDAKANPGRYTYGSSGAGGIYHSALLVFTRKAEIDMKHVAYRGGAPAMAALLGGHIHATALSPDEGKAMLDAGQVRALATFSDERYPGYPDVPTLLESGYDIYLENMKGLIGPKGMPGEVVAYLHDGFRKAIETETFRTLAEKANIETQYRDGPGFQKAMTEMYNAIGKAVE
ncbi:MAG: Bug family tripartite tricarboxylate transporter substrate binding protein [Alphaproteobacteria bacterium]